MKTIAIEVGAVRQQLGRRLKLRRVELDLKQEALAARLGVRQSQISEWELGRRALRIEQVLALAQALETSVAQLLGETP